MTTLPSDMDHYELSKHDFEAIDKALNFYIEYNVLSEQQEQLRDKFRAAHTGWLVTEKE